MRKRTQAREIALQALYQHDLCRRLGGTDEAEIEAFLQSASDDPEVRKYARVLIDGTLGALDDLDARIAAAAENWKLGRIAPVDRTILRIALFEILASDDIPPKVAINEAIDLAKKFSTEQSGAFVNGILDRIYQEVTKDDRKTPC